MKQVPISPELQGRLSAEWSEPVEVKIEGEELIFRHTYAARERDEVKVELDGLREAVKTVEAELERRIKDLRIQEADGSFAPSLIARIPAYETALRLLDSSKERGRG